MWLFQFLSVSCTACFTLVICHWRSIKMASVVASNTSCIFLGVVVLSLCMICSSGQQQSTTVWWSGVCTVSWVISGTYLDIHWRHINWGCGTTSLCKLRLTMLTRGTLTLTNFVSNMSYSLINGTDNSIQQPHWLQHGLIIISESWHFCRYSAKTLECLASLSVEGFSDTCYDLIASLIQHIVLHKPVSKLWILLTVGFPVVLLSTSSLVTSDLLLLAQL